MKTESHQQWIDRHRSPSATAAHLEMLEFFDGLPDELDDGEKFRCYLMQPCELDKFLAEDARQERAATRLWK